MTPGDPYMNAIQNDNVDMHFMAVASITPDGVVGDDGVERKCDTIVCATGFDVGFRPRFPVIGKNGVRHNSAPGKETRLRNTGQSPR
jgi:hypothetical protein